MKKNEVLDGFSAVFSSMGTAAEEEGYSNFPVFDERDDEDQTEVEENEEKDTDQDKSKSKSKQTKSKESDKEEEEDEDEDEDGDEETEKEEKGNEGSDVDESSQISLLFQAIAERSGLEVKEDELPKTADELLDQIDALVEERAKDTYASEEIKDLNDFVKNGGDISDYFTIRNDIDYDSLDMSNEFTQKQVLKEFLSKKGFSEQQIQKKISKYDEADILEDEAIDAVESLKEIHKEEKKALLKEQEIYMENLKKEQQKFKTSVVSEIEGLKEIRGIQIPKEDSKALIDYIFKLDQDGRTKYQKDYAKSTKNLIESAYFTMKGDSLIKYAKQKGETSAVEKFRDSLKGNKASGSKQKTTQGPIKPLWSLVSSQLTQK